MGWMTCWGHCFGCGRWFPFNPDRVPSFPVDGVREPVCGSCMLIVNVRRVEAGLEPFEILDGAYAPEEVA